MLVQYTYETAIFEELVAHSFIWPLYLSYKRSDTKSIWLGFVLEFSYLDLVPQL